MEYAMFKKATMLATGVLLALAFQQSRATVTGWMVDMESGIVISGYNDVRIPGTTGTKFSLSKDLDTETSPFIRARFGVTLNDRHSLECLIAPLRLSSSGTLDKPVRFHGVTFDAAVPLTAGYRFDSYRITYRYRFYETARLRIGGGVTAKVRDASISLSGGGTEREKLNTGFVPLLHFLVKWNFTGRAHVMLRGDALAAPQGRAEDVLIAFGQRFGKHLTVKLGYRMLEGGADGDEVYTFALLHYMVAGIILEL
jgi:hypothetical protein